VKGSGNAADLLADVVTLTDAHSSEDNDEDKSHEENLLEQAVLHNLRKGKDEAQDALKNVLDILDKSIFSENRKRLIDEKLKVAIEKLEILLAHGLPGITLRAASAASLTPSLPSSLPSSSLPPSLLSPFSHSLFLANFRLLRLRRLLLRLLLCRRLRPRRLLRRRLLQKEKKNHLFSNLLASP